MRFLRSPRRAPDAGHGGAAERERRPDGPLEAEDETARGTRPLETAEPGAEDARASELIGEFEAGLSDLAQRQVRFARFAWEPPGQLDRRGRWVVLEAIDATAEDGRRVGLSPGESLELEDLGGEEPGRASWRFARVKDGRTVHIEAGPGGAWPVGLERPRTGTEGS